MLSTEPGEVQGACSPAERTNASATGCVGDSQRPPFESDRSLGYPACAGSAIDAPWYLTIHHVP
jgi:hypothetical protein